MKVNKAAGLVILFFGLLLVASFIVYAAGSSEIPSDDDDDDRELTNKSSNSTINSNKTIKNETERTIRKMMNRTDDDDDRRKCDYKDNRTQRIKCRLMNKMEEGEDENGTINFEKRVPEACRSLRNPVACIALYKRVHNNGCYSLDGRNKDVCLKRAANITEAKLKDISREERNQKAREYIVLLLYELEERIEQGNEDGKISDGDAAAIIDLIVKIKSDILNGEKKDVVLPELKELRDKLRAVKTKTGGNETA